MTRATILDLRDSPWVDGPGRTILDCATSLRERGYDLVIGTFSGGEQKTSAYAEEARRRGLTVKAIQERGPFDRRVVGQVMRLIDEVGADIVHTHDFRSNVFGLLAARMRRRPTVTTVHGWIANDLKGKLYVAADKAILRFFNRIITVSERTRGLVEKARVPQHRVTVIPNALTLDRYLPDRHDDAFRRELGVDRDTLLIANIGRLSPEKGQLEFLQAARELRRQHANLRFILIGIGPDQEKLERFVEANGLREAVVFAGFRHDMISVYNGLDLVVQSSCTEGMPNVVLEALLMEVPVIATDVGGTAEIIEHGQTGVLIRPGAVGEIVEQIAAHCRQPAELRAMARRGRQLVSERYDHRRRVDRLALLYDGLLGADR
jgi:glycosyltransferase involved in cell wall biosynthesis